MELEFHQLRMRYSDLRISLPGYEARLTASLVAEGQLHPVLVVSGAGSEEPSEYVLIDGYRRVKALARLGRDTVEGVVLPLTEPAALMFRHCQESVHPRTALEDGWLLRELIEQHGMTQAELSRQLQPGACAAGIGAGAGAKGESLRSWGDEVSGALGPGQEICLRGAGAASFNAADQRAGDGSNL